MDNHYQTYNNNPPPRQPDQNYGGQQGNNFYRDDYGGGNNNNSNNNNNNNNRRNGGGGGGGAMRDHRGRRGGGNERYNNDRPYNKRPNRPMGGNFKGGKNEHVDDPDNAREKPCRTLFVRNVQYDTHESDIKALFDKYGEVKDVFNLIENRGMIFVTFYDVRAAEEAKRAMQNIFLKDRKIDVHYSLPKEEEEKAKCDRTKNQGTLLYTLKNSSVELDDNELQAYFSRFGEVKAIRVPHFKKSTAHNYSHSERNQQRLVEYYDSRACVDAYDATYNTEYKGGKWDVAFFWDHPYKDRQNSHQKREKNYERDDNQRNNRRRNDTMRQGDNMRGDPMRQGDTMRGDYMRQNDSMRQNDLRQPDAVRGRDNYDHYNGIRNDNRYPHANVDPRLQAYNPEPAIQQPMPSMIPSPAVTADSQRLEQAQKAQQILSMLAHSQQSQPQATSLTSPFQPTNIQSPPVKQQQHQQPFVQPVPPTEGQNAQIQQLLGLLGQVAQQQQQQQHHHHQIPVQQQPQQHVSPPTMQQNVAPIPGMDPATALSQLAALLQQQQQQQQQHSHQGQ